MNEPKTLTIKFNDKGHIEKVYRGENIKISGGEEIKPSGYLDEEEGGEFDKIKISHLYSIHLFKHYSSPVRWGCHDRRCKYWC